MTSAKWDVKLAVISGVGSGIGKAIAKELLADGSDLIAVDLRLSGEVMVELEEAKQKANQKIIPVEANVVDAPVLREKISTVVAQHGSPDFALNCAGINRTGNFEKISDDDYAAVINVNLLGSRNFSVSVLPHMNEGSRFVLLASMGGLVSNYAYSAYSASKFGVVGLASVLRTEYAAVGVGVSVVCPPEIPTPMVEEEMKNMHPVQRGLKDTAGLVTLEELIPYMLKKTIIDKQYKVIPGAAAKLVYFASRYLPEWIMNGYLDSQVRKLFAENPTAPKR